MTKKFLQTEAAGITKKCEEVWRKGGVFFGEEEEFYVTRSMDIASKRRVQ